MQNIVKKKSSMSLATKITIMVILMVIICSVSVGVFVYRRIEADYYSLKGVQAQTAASSLASALDWRSIQIILETEEKNEYYEFIKETIIETGARMPDLAYTYIMSMQEPDFFIIYGQDPNAFLTLDLGYLYPLEAWNEAAIRSHIDGVHAYSAPYSVPGYGNLVSGYAPIINDAGNAIAIVGFDIFLEDILAELADIRNNISIIIAVFVLASIVIAVLFIRRIEKHNISLLEANQRAESASMAKSDFLAKMSHEIRTPMNAIIGISQIQLQQENLPDEYSLALGKIHSSGNILLGIINDILDLSKIEAGKMEINPVEYDVPSLINDAVQLNIVRIGSKPVDFILDIDEKLPSKLIGDELRLKQILSNLLSNAIKYTEKGYVKLLVKHTVQDEGIKLIFIVEDTGQGMKPEDRERLFSGYLRFNTNINRNTEGTGIGLNITKSLTELMDGTIEVESEYGKGSVFTVTVRQTAVECKPIGHELSEKLRNFTFTGDKQTARLQITREPMPYGKVLIVDDVETNLYVAEGLLAPYKLMTETALSGFETIEKVGSGKVYDIIFMDHMMPVMDGIETTKQLRDSGYTQPIVALTANAIVGQADLFLANGFDDFISKPIDIRQLNAVLTKYIRDKHAHEIIEDVVPKEKLETELPLLKVFAKDAKKALPVLETTLNNITAATDENLHLFTINVHAMKSALANIGETAASDLASALEQAGNARDKTAIQSGTQNLIDALKLIIARVDIKTENSWTVEDEDLVYLREQLKIINKACVDYDEQTASAALVNLEKMSWTKETRELLDTIAAHLLHSEFEEIADVLRGKK